MIKEALVLQKFAVCFTFTLNDSKSFVVLLLCLLFVPSSLSISFPPSSSFSHHLLVIVRSPYMPFFVFSLFVVFVSCFLYLLCVFSSSTYLFFVSLAFLVSLSSLSLARTGKITQSSILSFSLTKTYKCIKK